MSKYQRKKNVALLISLMPLNVVRVFLYRLILGYQIDWSVKIGILTIIAVDEAIVKEQTNIGRYNLFLGPCQIKIEDGVVIGNNNELSCDEWVLNEKHKNNVGYLRLCKIGKKSLINHGHYIDLVGKFELQENSWIAGRNSQFWTHGGRASENSILIGKNCYIASAVKFSSGTQIGNNILVGMGSVVTKKITIDDAFIAGVPARVIKDNYDWKTKKIKD